MLQQVFATGKAETRLHLKPRYYRAPYHMTLQRGITTMKRPYDRARDTREKLFYLFLVAQICAIFSMVVGVLFFILRLMKLI
jgi:hypothetical protein